MAPVPARDRQRPLGRRNSNLLIPDDAALHPPGPPAASFWELRADRLSARLPLTGPQARLRPTPDLTVTDRTQRDADIALQQIKTAP